MRYLLCGHNHHKINKNNTTIYYGLVKIHFPAAAIANIILT